MNVEAYLRRDYITNLVLEGKRTDGRKFDEYRKIEITKDYVGEKAEGSALVKLGDTTVLAGVSLDVGEPYPDRPNDGVLTTSAELRPMADPRFETGPPREGSIELARVVDRGIRESGSVELDKLLIEDEKVWVVFVDLHILDNNGNLIDACGIAAITALLNTRTPKYEDGVIVRDETSGKLPVTCLPIPCTVAKIKDKLLFDSTIDEEYAMDARLTVTTTDTINAMQKSGTGSFTVDEVDQVIDLAFKNSKDIVKLVKG